MAVKPHVAASLLDLVGNTPLVELKPEGDDLMVSIADDGVGLNAKADPRSTGMGQRIVSAMAAKLDATAERDPNHHGTRIVLRFRRIPAVTPKSSKAAAG